MTLQRRDGWMNGALLPVKQPAAEVG